MDKINFQNLPDTTTPVNATNLNQLQINVENGIADAIKEEITTGIEFATNEYIDGEQVYRKRIDTGALPNAAGKQVSSGLTPSNINIVRIQGAAKATNGTQLPLPFVSVTAENCVSVSLQSTGNVQVQTGTDRTVYTQSYVDLYYLKITT